MSLGFLITALVIVATPGTGVLYTLAAGLAHGARASVIAAVGCTLGIVPHMAAAMLGVAAILHRSALAFAVLKYVGVAYLLYMAWTTFRDSGTLAVPEEGSGAQRTARRVIGAGIAINLLNPKLTLFFFAFLPQFVPVHAGSQFGRMLLLSAVFMAMTFIVFAGYGIIAAALRRHVIARPKLLARIRTGFAAAFLALGARLAVTSR